jgi:hypothetical protein
MSSGNKGMPSRIQSKRKKKRLLDLARLLEL